MTASASRELGAVIKLRTKLIGSGLVVFALVGGFVVYQQVSDSKAPQPAAAKPVRVLWADGSEVGTVKLDGFGAANKIDLPPETELIWQAAERELAQKGLDSDKLSKGGHTVQLTVDPAAQKLARATIDEVIAGQPENLRESLVAVDPSSGRIIAYAGYNKEKAGLDYAGHVWQNPGTTYMPFDLLALLQKGDGLNEVYDGTSPRMFGGSRISNVEGSDCANCTVAEAMKRSTNTVFAEIAYTTVGTRNVARAAVQAGIPANVGLRKTPMEGTGVEAPNVNIALGGSDYEARIVDLAGSYATFAANGKKRKPHLVAKVTDPDNGNAVVYNGDAEAVGEQVFDLKVARNVTETLLPVPAYVKLPCAGGHTCAAKPGDHGCAASNSTTKEDNCVAWMVGYTPQLSTAVWIGSDTTAALKAADGSKVLGSRQPGRIWQKFMDGYHNGKSPQPFPPFEPIGQK